MEWYEKMLHLIAHKRGKFKRKKVKRNSVQSMCIPRGCTNICEIMKNAQGAEGEKKSKKRK